MKLTILSLLVILFTTVVFATEEKGGTTIRLGVVVPLSGDFAYQGQFIKNGVELARESLGSRAKNIEIYYEDACLPKNAVTSAKRLVAEQIHAVVGSYCVIGMVAMAPIFERNKILSFQTSVVPDAILDAGEYIVTTNVAIEDEARELARLAALKLKKRRAGIFYFPSDWGEDYTRYFADEFTARGGVVVSKDLRQLDQVDFRSQLIRMKAKGVDALFIADISSALGNIVKQANGLGMKVEFLSTNEAEDPQFFKAAGDYAAGMRIFVPESAVLSKSSQEFRTVYSTRYGGVPPVTATNAYDATRIAIELITQCNFDRECLGSAAYKIRDYQGVSGTFSIEKDGRTRRTFVEKRAKSSRFIRVN